MKCGHRVAYVQDFANQFIPLRPDGCIICERDELQSKLEDAEKRIENLCAVIEAQHQARNILAGDINLGIATLNKELQSRLHSLESALAAAGIEIGDGPECLLSAPVVERGSTVADGFKALAEAGGEHVHLWSDAGPNGLRECLWCRAKS